MAAFAAPLVPLVAKGAFAQAATVAAASFAYFGAQYDGFRRSPPKAVRPPGLSEMQQLVAAAIEGSKTLVASLPNPLGPPPLLDLGTRLVGMLWAYLNGREKTRPPEWYNLPEPGEAVGHWVGQPGTYSWQVRYFLGGELIALAQPGGISRTNVQSLTTYVVTMPSGVLRPKVFIRFNDGTTEDRCASINASDNPCNEFLPEWNHVVEVVFKSPDAGSTYVELPPDETYDPQLAVGTAEPPITPEPLTFAPDQYPEPLPPLPFAPPPALDPVPVTQPEPQPLSPGGGLTVTTSPPLPVVVPAPGPYQPAPFPPGDPLTNSGEVAPAPAPLIQPTPVDAHFPVSGEAPVTGNGPEPTLVGIAKELGRLEQKAERIMNNPWGEGPGAPGPDLLGQLAEGLLQLLLTADGAGGYGINSPCNKDPETGEQLPDLVAGWGASVGQMSAMRKRLDALAQLMQYQKDLPQPTCKKPTPSGEWVTVNFEEI